MPTAKFSPGRLVTTPGVLAQVPANEVLLAQSPAICAVTGVT